MLIKEYGFRALYHQFVIIRLNDRLRSANNLFTEQSANGALTFCYVDHQVGVTFELLAATHIGETIRILDDLDSSRREIYRHSAVEECEAWVIDSTKSNVSAYDAKREQINKIYEGDMGITSFRLMENIDHLRAPGFPDDMLAILDKTADKPEAIWVRVSGFEGQFIVGNLLNEPYANVGLHVGDKVYMILRQTENGLMVYIQ